MSIETLERAIARLEELKAGATGLPWGEARYSIVGDFNGDPADRDFGEIIAPSFGERGNVRLVVALSRTVDPLLDMLREGIREVLRSDTYLTDIAKAAIALAQAILGESDGV